MSYLSTTYRIAATALIIVTSAFSCAAQKAISISFSPAATLSYTGVSGTFPLTFQYGRHSLYAGPLVDQSSAGGNVYNAWGVNAGYGYTLLSGKHLSSSALVDYMRQTNVGAFQSISYEDVIHQLNLCLGVKYSFGEGRLAVGAVVGKGIASENYYNTYSKSDESQINMSDLFRLQLHWRVWKL